MYYLLNYVPCILNIIDTTVRFKIDIGVFYIICLFAQPLYLLIVNIPFICKKSVSYVGSIICMFSVIAFNVLYTMLVNKILTGFFIGDAPEEIYYIMVGVPTLIIVLGLGIVFFIKKR